MKKIIYSFVILAAVGFQSCEDTVEGLNNDPNNFTDAPLSLVLNHSNLNMVVLAEAHAARIATMFTDQFGGNDRQYGTLNIYSTLQTDYDEIWEDVYQRGISQAQIAKQKANEAGNAALEGHAQILEAYFFGEAALLFGDIPFSEVNNPEFLDPQYEGQVAVLTNVVSLLESAATLAGASPASNNVFNTSSSWTQVANALRARYLLALGRTADALTAATAANFTSKGNDLEIIHTSTNYAENMWYQFQVEQRQDYLKVLGSKDYSFMSKMLNDTTAQYKGNAKTNESARYSFYVSADGRDLNTSAGGFAGIDTNFPVVSFEEVQLIIAEANVGGDNAAALAALNAVRASHAATFTGGQYDPYVIADFQAGGIAFDGTAENSSLLLEIMKEKYCSVIGLPTYSDVRRNNNLLNVPIKGTGTTVIPQRFLYPQTEAASNSNYPGLVDQFVPTAVNQ